MVGLALGSYFSTKKLSKLEKDARIYKIVQCLICVYPLILIGIFQILKDQTSVFLEYSFPLFSFIPGFMGGIQFPLGSKIVLEKTKNLSGTASILYSADLLGAFIGAFLISLIFIPLVGIYSTCIAITVLNLGALAVLVGE
jgi:predicted membrane-bound spermidine synthase